MRVTRASLEGFELLAKLGQGGTGVVFKARQIHMDRIVAVKILLPRFARDKQSVGRFLREARAAARLSHPNIVGGLDVGTSRGLYYYVMEFVEGRTLFELLAEIDNLPWRQAVRIARQVASALAHADAHGLIHRDVKPGNILLARDGTAKLLDLGMARFRVDAGSEITLAGSVMGTPFYMSPEQVLARRDLDIRTDLDSLGITLYEMLAGRPPHVAPNPLAVLHKHVHEPVRWDLPGVPPALQKVGRRLTERNRDRRYRRVLDVVADLERLERAAVEAPPVRPAVRVRAPAGSRPRPSKRSLLVGLSAAGALLLLAAAVAFGTTRMTREEQPVPLSRPIPPPKPLQPENVAQPGGNAVALPPPVALHPPRAPEPEKAVLPPPDVTERTAGDLLRIAERARQEEQPAKFFDLIEAYPDTKAAETARIRLTGRKPAKRPAAPK